jgi:ribosome maturation protein Sdo1
MLNDLEEISIQSSMTGDKGRATTARALVRGKSAVAIETALQDARVTADGATVVTSTDHVQEALKVMQDKKPISFYSRKLNASQKSYATTKREVLSTIDPARNTKISFFVIL